MIGGKAMPVENLKLIGQGLLIQKCEFCVWRKCKNSCWHGYHARSLVTSDHNHSAHDIENENANRFDKLPYLLSEYMFFHFNFFI